MTATEPGTGVHRLRAVVARAVSRVGGVPAVRILAAVLRSYDAAGGGLVAGGLAYAALLAILPGLLLVLSVLGLAVDDAAARADVVSWIRDTLPPLGPVAEVALAQVAAGAVPTSIVATLGLIWASSRFYGSLDAAFARIFAAPAPRGAVERTVRGIVATLALVVVPFAALALGWLASWLLDIAPPSLAPTGPARGAWQLASPAISLAVFVGGTALVYRLVPVRPPSLRALGLPAMVVGVTLTLVTQLFAVVASRLVGVAALFGTFLAAFALLAWLSLALNVLLLGAAWTRVRDGTPADTVPPETVPPVESPARTDPGAA